MEEPIPIPKNIIVDKKCSSGDTYSFYVAISEEKSNGQLCYYVGWSKDLEEREHQHRNTSKGAKFFNNCNKDNIFIFIPMPVKIITYREKTLVTYLETILACIVQYNYPSSKVIGGNFNRYECNITHEKIIAYISKIFKEKDAIDYEIYQNFLSLILEKPIDYTINYIKETMFLRMPVEEEPSRETDNPNTIDIIMW